MKRIVKIAALIGAVVLGYHAYRVINNIVIPHIRIRFFPTEQEVRMFKQFQDINVVNDLDEEVCFEVMRNENRVVEWRSGKSNFTGCFASEGRLRVFVPSKQGWYTITYSYPYPLTQKTPWYLVGPMLISVKLSSLIDSLDSGSVECIVGPYDSAPREMVTDIKVTFEKGAAPERTAENDLTGKDIKD